MNKRELFKSNDVPYINIKHCLIVKRENSFPSDNVTSVFAFVRNEDGEFLVFEHSMDDNRKIDIAGGHVEKNESFLTAVQREVLEETGYSIKNIKYVATKYISLYGEKPINYKYPFPNSNMLFFVANVDKKVTDALFDDSAKAFFMSYNDLYEMLPDETKCILKSIIDDDI